MRAQTSCLETTLKADKPFEPPACRGGFPLLKVGLPKLGVLRGRPCDQTGVLGFGKNVRYILRVLFKIKIKSYPTVDLERGRGGERGEKGRDGESIFLKTKIM